MNINIVHLPHTFPYLIDLSLAFHKHGFNTVTLVANGFNFEQIQALENYASQYPFLRILDIPTKRILSHGEALNFAFMHTQDEIFCFADHDIFPTDSIVATIRLNLENHDVVCFGDRPENMNTDYKGFAASSLSTRSGHTLATSFFSAYKRSVVDFVSKAYKVGFEQYFRKSQVPETLEFHEDIQSLKEPFLIDTCKVLSLAMNLSDKKTIHLGSDMVCHLGGLCGAINRFINSDFKIKKEFTIQNLPSKDLLEEYYRINQQRHPKVLELKRTISDFSLQLLIALKKGVETPSFVCDDENHYELVSELKQQTSHVFS